MTAFSSQTANRRESTGVFLDPSEHDRSETVHVTAHQIAVISVRHHRAPVALRETLAFSDSCADAFLAQLKQNFPALESAVMLSTCNRTELYLAAPKMTPLLPKVSHELALARGLSDFSVIQPSAAIYLNEDAVRHLARVASGLDSMILGEDQILGQVKTALQRAQRQKTAGTVLDRAFKTALITGRRVRQETGIAHRDASLSHAALKLAYQQNPALLHAPMCILGAGKMVDILLSALQTARQEAGISHAETLSQVAVVNRSEKRLQTLVNRFGVRGLMWPQLSQGLANAHTIFIATGAPHPVLFDDMLPAPCPQHPDATLTLIDMAVPRNVDVSVTRLPHVRLYNTDDLATMAPELAAQWMSAEAMAHQIEAAEGIVFEELTRFCQWQQGLSGHQTLARFQARLNGLYEAALHENTRSLEEAHRPVVHRLVHQASRQVMNQMLHEPFVQLRQLASQPNHAYDQSLASLRQLFAL